MEWLLNLLVISKVLKSFAKHFSIFIGQRTFFDGFGSFFNIIFKTNKFNLNSILI